MAVFLNTGLQRANQDAKTPIWCALQLSPSVFGVFDAFHDETGRQAHLIGEVAKALMANAETLFVGPPTIDKIDVLGLKNDGSV